MNQEKIGRFIATCRKEQKLTQEQLAEKLGVTDRSISRWENGKTMPDVSLFEDLCKELNISINELLKGEKIENNNTKSQLSAEILSEYSFYLKKNEKRKIVILLGVIIILISMLLVLLVLMCNKTFFRNSYDLDFMDGISIPIPKYSFYRGTGGMEEYTTKLKTLKQPDEVNILIDRYLNTLDEIKCNSETYYYDDKNDFIIMQYRINNDGIGFVNTIYISYTNGNVCN